MFSFRLNVFVVPLSSISKLNTNSLRPTERVCEDSGGDTQINQAGYTDTEETDASRLRRDKGFVNHLIFRRRGFQIPMLAPFLILTFAWVVVPSNAQDIKGTNVVDSRFRHSIIRFRIVTASDSDSFLMIGFEPTDGASDFVDLHYYSDQRSEETNVRMSPSSPSVPMSFAPIHLEPGHKLSYRFTWSVDGQSTTSEWFTFGEQEGFTSRVEPTPQGQWRVTFSNGDGADVKDLQLYYQFDQGPWHHQTMQPSNNRGFYESLLAVDGSVLTYFFTYPEPAGGDTITTELFHFTAAQISTSSPQLGPDTVGQVGAPVGQGGPALPSQPPVVSGVEPLASHTAPDFVHAISRTQDGSYQLSFQPKPLGKDVLFVDMTARNQYVAVQWRLTPDSSGNGILTHPPIQLSPHDVLTYDFSDWLAGMAGARTSSLVTYSPSQNVITEVRQQQSVTTSSSKNVGMPTANEQLFQPAPLTGLGRQVGPAGPGFGGVDGVTVDFVPVSLDQGDGWSMWMPCSTTCGPGIRTRSCTYPPDSAKTCSGINVERCELSPCPGDAGRATSGGRGARPTLTSARPAPQQPAPIPEYPTTCAPDQYECQMTKLCLPCAKPETRSAPYCLDCLALLQCETDFACQLSEVCKVCGKLDTSRWPQACKDSKEMQACENL
eukprot:g24531.t1